jgi:hypothetical protein
MFYRKYSKTIPFIQYVIKQGLIDTFAYANSIGIYSFATFFIDEKGSVMQLMNSTLPAFEIEYYVQKGNEALLLHINKGKS